MKILIFGDSNTWGYDPLTGDRQQGRFVDLLQAKHPKWIIKDNGQNGRLFFSPLPYFGDIDGSKQIARFLRQEDPYDLVIILLGTNDARRMFHSNLSSWLESFKRFKAVVVQANQDVAHQTHTPIAPILFVPPCRLAASKDVLNRSGLETMGESGRLIVENSEVAMRQALHEDNVQVLSTPSFLGGKIDGIHLDSQGHQAMADFLEQAIVKTCCEPCSR